MPEFWLRGGKNEQQLSLMAFTIYVSAGGTEFRWPSGGLEVCVVRVCTAESRAASVQRAAFVLRGPTEKESSHSK